MTQKKSSPLNSKLKRTSAAKSSGAPAALTARKAVASAKPMETAKSSALAKNAAAAKGLATAKRVAAAKQPAAIAHRDTAVARNPANAAPQERKSANGRPTLEALKALPTDDIWVHYRVAVGERPRDEVWIEAMRNVLMEAHYPLVKHIAERLLQTLPKSIELDDLVSAGLFGLMDAIRGFDPARGIKFKTYCTTRIRGSILDQLRSQDWVPRLVRLKAGRIEKALQKLQGEYGREPTHAELANALRMEHGELSQEISSSRAKTMFSLQERWDDRDDDSGLEKVEIVEDRTAVDPIGEINRRDLMTYITRSLTHKERFIIEQYYQVGHTMREIGEMLALTESRVCQIHSNVMGRLKDLLPPNAGDTHV